MTHNRQFLNDALCASKTIPNKLAMQILIHPIMALVTLMTKYIPYDGDQTRVHFARKLVPSVIILLVET